MSALIYCAPPSLKGILCRYSVAVRKPKMIETDGTLGAPVHPVVFDRTPAADCGDGGHAEKD